MRDQSVPKDGLPAASAGGRKSPARQPGGYVAVRHTLGYARVSKETEAGLSVEAQAVKIRQMAALRDLPLAAGDVIVDDGASAKDLNRPGMAWLLAQIDAGAVHTIIIAKLDRLTRSVKDLADLLVRFDRRKVALISVAEQLDTSTAIGELIMNIMVSVSQWERKAIGERTRDVMRHKKAKGERVGTLPFGFQLVAGCRLQLEPNPVEQDKLARIRDLKATGRSTRKIADALNQLGLTTRRATPWRGQYVARLLRRES